MLKFHAEKIYLDDKSFWVTYANINVGVTKIFRQNNFKDDHISMMSE